MVQRHTQTTVVHTLLYFVPVILLALFANNLLRLIGAGFFFGYSDAKELFFVALLILLSLATAQKFSPFVKKNKIKLLLVLIGILILGNAFSFFVFVTSNNNILTHGSYVVYNAQLGQFSAMSITHNHAFKPILAPLTILLSSVQSAQYDFGLPIIAMMPPYFGIVYVLGFLLLCATLLLSLYVFSQRVHDKKNKIAFVVPHVWIYACALYLIFKNVVDGGLFTSGFFVGITVLILYVYVGISLEKKVVRTWGVGAVVCIVVITALQCIFTGASVFTSPATIGTIVLYSFLEVASQLVFICGIAGLFVAIEKKKLVFGGVCLILLFASVVSVLAYYHTFEPDTFNRFFSNESVSFKKGDIVLAVPSEVRNSTCLEKIDSNIEMYFYRVECTSTTTKDISASKNLKSRDNIVEWNKSCEYQLEQGRMLLYTHDTLGALPEPSTSLLSHVTITPCTIGNCSYRLQYFISRCIVDPRFVVTTYLANAGLRHGILYT